MSTVVQMKNDSVIQMRPDRKLALLVDGNAHVCRAFFALQGLTDPKGRPINAVFGFLKILLYIIEKYVPSHIAIAFDSRSQRRREIYPDYKSNRKDFQQTSEFIDSLVPQLEISREMTETLGLFTVKKDDYEADDILCELVHQCLKDNLDVLIFSPDKDMAQLVTEDGRVKILCTSTMKTGEEILGYEEICQKFQVTPNQIVDLLALMGDSADSIPGVHGIGEVTAAKLLKQYGNVAGIYENLSKLTPALQKKLVEGHDMAYISYKLAELKPRQELVAVRGFLNDGEFKTFSPVSREYLTTLGFKSLLSRV